MTASLARHAVALWPLLRAVPGTVHAQSLGTFRWQLQPYCNIITVQVTQIGSVYRLEGTDDRCGAGADQSSVIGTAFQNPDGTHRLRFEHRVHARRRPRAGERGHRASARSAAPGETAEATRATSC